MSYGKKFHMSRRKMPVKHVYNDGATRWSNKRPEPEERMVWRKRDENFITERIMKFLRGNKDREE